MSQAKSDLDEKQQAEYEKRLAAYKPIGTFANLGIVAFKPLVVGNSIDEKRAVTEFGLNERQLPFLLLELIAAGFIKADDEVKEAPADGIEKTPIEAIADGSTHELTIGEPHEDQGEA